MNCSFDRPDVISSFYLFYFEQMARNPEAYSAYAQHPAFVALRQAGQHPAFVALW
jgi:hypothetical protein